MLSIDSSTPVASVAVQSEQALLGEAMLNTKNTHSEKLLLLLEQLLQELGLTLGDVDVVSVAKGPGSFTGLRIGMATAKGLVQGGGQRLIAVPTLDALAYNMAGVPGLICPILNAKRDEVYTALYCMNDADQLERLTAYMAVKPQALVEEILEYSDRVCFLGDGVAVFGSMLAERLGSQMWTAPLNQMLPKASSIGALALERALREEYDDLYGCDLIYVRRSEAEIKWDLLHGTTSV